MDFSLNEIQQDIANLAGQILRRASTPERLDTLEAGGQRLDRQLWAELVDAGLAAVAIPEARGGAGLGFFETCLVLEQVGRTVAAVPLAGHGVGLMALHHAGADAALDCLLAGHGWLAASARTDAGNKLRAEGGQLWGELGAVPFAEGSQCLLLPARRDGAWQLFLLDTAQPGVRFEAQLTTALEPRARVYFDAVAATALGDGELVEWLRERIIAATCAVQTGVLGEMIAMSTRYVSEREQFGAKIGSFQAVSHRMADTYIDLMNLRLLAQSAAAMLDRQPLATLEVLAAQSWCAEAGHRVSASCQHVHGGMGHDRDYPLWRYAVWSRHNELVHGGVSENYAAIGAAIAGAPAAAAL